MAEPVPLRKVCAHCGSKHHAVGATRCMWCKKPLATVLPHGENYPLATTPDTGTTASTYGAWLQVPEAVPGLALRTCGNALASVGALYGLLFVVSLAYVPPLWNSNVAIRGQGKDEFVRERRAELHSVAFSADLVGATKGDTADFTSFRHDIGAGIANAIATAMRPLGYAALAPATYTPVSVPRLVELDANTQAEVTAGYPKQWEPAATFPGFVLVAALTLLVIHTGRSVSEGRKHASRELLALVGLSLLAALIVFGYGPYWVAAVLLAVSGFLGWLAIAANSWRKHTVPEP